MNRLREWGAMEDEDNPSACCMLGRRAGNKWVHFSETENLSGGLGSCGFSGAESPQPSPQLR